ncbi:DUF1045 domain-containing protein [Rhizobiales bacterium RZME27]|uniref:DUF1045 domain-containing protein n=1 Tax=Endobacterium cereale TaxID=2663029 RepID=A0A6A8A521_9HYPH|nr:DUF1045 domain-containing protein [Endobacterium cereale]MEB2845005.1 DUF1045 domain-containing protein [Endobacterium cereale]MQY44917.1 DUF1045 domain-containing protein [Endobacterium cereale]
MRYAIYFTPAKDDPLTQAASIWLGRDAYEGRDLAVPIDTGLAEDEWRTMTADPRRYAFHATLKAPFTLAEGKDEASLIATVDAFAEKTDAFDIRELIVAGLGPFFALVPGAPDPTLQNFAGSIVEHFEPFRAPLSDADIVRRKPEKLSEPQRNYLHRYGYPYVMEEFRFHMTLTGPVPEERREAMHALLTERFATFAGKPRRVDALTVFVEPQRGAPFSVLHRAPLKDDLGRRVFA